MANWLQKIFPPARDQASRNLPTAYRRNPLGLPARKAAPDNLPNASIIYGMAAAALFVIALYFMFFEHKWITGALVMLPAVCFLGFALHFLKYPQG
ncbi:MAG: hypothetical protein AB7H77_05905 [Bdellovibrionales bacterium]